jgi:carboxymethylenebutenolidase
MKAKKMVRRRSIGRPPRARTRGGQILFLLLLLLACGAGCTGFPDDPGSTTETPATSTPTPLPVPTAEKTGLQTRNDDVSIESGNLSYPAYLVEPTVEGMYPAVILLHSVNGAEPGYRELSDMLAAEGFVVLAPEWQTYEKFPNDAMVEVLVIDSVRFLRSRPEVDSERIGLTGFCAGGRYVMLFLPRIKDLQSGVAWYGFPYSGGFHNQFTPAELIMGLEDPLLIIHGTRDEASPISGIYRYATELDQAEKYFELKVYQGQQHGFMIENGTLSKSFVAFDAFQEMVNFFDRTLV